MKKNKNSKAGKILFMAVAVVLVAAVSVSFTLAYLTAQTKVLDNQFTASGGITGEVLEPKFDEKEANKYLPGKEVPKDPMIQNETTDASVYVGARLDFYIDIADEEDWQQVSYETFSKFVSIKNSGTSGFNTTDWSDITTSVSPNTKGSEFFMYNKVLGKFDNDKVVKSDSGYNNDDSSEENGDNTKPIFTSVTADANITISDESVGLEANVTENSDISSITKEDNVFYTDGVKNTKCVFKNFKFKIVINGYGVKDDSSLGSDAGGKKTAAQALIIAGLKTE